MVPLFFTNSFHEMVYIYVSSFLMLEFDHPVCINPGCYKLWSKACQCGLESHKDASASPIQDVIVSFFSQSFVLEYWSNNFPLNVSLCIMEQLTLQKKTSCKFLFFVGNAWNLLSTILYICIDLNVSSCTGCIMLVIISVQPNDIYVQMKCISFKLKTATAL